MTVTLEKTAQTLFTDYTNNYVHTLYPDADFSDEDLKKKIQYVVQNRTVMFLAYTLGGNYKDFLNVSVVSEELAATITELFESEYCSPEGIRLWWYDVGRVWAFKHRAEIKQQELDNTIAWVIRDDTKGKFVNLTSSGYDLVNAPVEAIAFAINAPGVTKESLETIANTVTNSSVRVFYMKRAALNTTNINTSGVNL